MIDWDLREIEIFQAAQIDGGDCIARWIRALAKRVDAARRAKAMLDHMFVESVSREVRFWGEQSELLSRREPQHRATSSAHRAVASQR